MRGVADQRQPFGDERARGEQPERKGAARPDHRDVAEMQAEAFLQLGMEFIVGQRDDALRLARVLGPHDRRALARQRQDRERPRGQEMFLGAAVVLALMRHRGDDRRLIVIPSMRGDAGLFADFRARAVGADQKPRGNRLAVGELDVDRMVAAFSKPADRARAQFDAELLRLLDQRIDQMPVLDHVRERFARLHLAAESEEGRPHRVVELGVRHHHVEDRLRLRRDRVPDLDRLEQPARGRRDRRGARVLRLRRRQRRIDHGHRKPFAQPLAQRDGQRQAGKAGAADHYVTPLVSDSRHSFPCAGALRPPPERPGRPSEAAILGYSGTWRTSGRPLIWIKNLAATLDESITSRWGVVEDREVPALRSPPRRKGQIP